MSAWANKMLENWHEDALGSLVLTVFIILTVLTAMAVLIVLTGLTVLAVLIVLTVLTVLSVLTDKFYVIWYLKKKMIKYFITRV